MPGRQILRMGVGYTFESDSTRYVLELKVQPNSWLRMVPILGQMRLFRMGATVGFKFNIETIEVNESVPDETEGKKRERIVLLANGKPHHTNWLEFEIPKTVGGKTTAITDSFFLEFTGDAQLRIRGGSRASNTCYSFQVQEPAYAVFNWVVGLLAGVLGGVLVLIFG